MSILGQSEGFKLFLLSPLFAAVANLVLALFIYLRGRHGRLNQIFFIWGMSLFLWNAGAFILFLVQRPDLALLVARILHMGVIMIPVTALHLCVLITGAKKPWILKAGYVVSVLLLLCNLTPYFIADVRQVSYGWFSVAGPGFWVYSNLVPVLSLPAIYILYKNGPGSSETRKRRFRTLLTANCLLLVMGTHDLFPVLGYDFYPFTQVRILPWGTFASGIYGLLVAYGVFQDQMLNVRVTVGRHAATALRMSFFLGLCVLGLIIAAFFVPSGLTTPVFVSFFIVILCASTFSAVFFPKLFGGNAIGASLERLILGDRFEYQEQIRAFTARLHRYTEVSAMLEDTAAFLRDAMSITSVNIVVLSLRSTVVAHRCSQPASTVFASVQGNSRTIAFLRSSGTSMLDLRSPVSPASPLHALETPARAEVVSWGAEQVYALQGQEGLMGIMALGRKADQTPFTSLDAELLLALADRLGWVLERLRLAQQAAMTEKLELMSIMSRGLAHDINNLLTPISTFLQFAKNLTPDTPEDIEFQDTAMRSLDTIKTYIREAIFFANTQKIQLSLITGRELFRIVAEITKVRAENRGVKVICHPWNGELRADLVLLQRLLGNLIDNAVDASPRGGTVELSAQTTESHTWVTFEIADRGAGISPENLEKVFHPYFTTKDSGDKIRGFGLGLTTCQKIVHLHNGTITLKSILGAGTNVRVEIPTNPDPNHLGE